MFLHFDHEWNWTKLKENGRNWTELNKIEQTRTELNEIEWKWMKMNENGQKWTELNEIERNPKGQSKSKPFHFILYQNCYWTVSQLLTIKARDSAWRHQILGIVIHMLSITFCIVMLNVIMLCVIMLTAVGMTVV